MTLFSDKSNTTKDTPTSFTLKPFNRLHGPSFSEVTTSAPKGIHSKYKISRIQQNRQNDSYEEEEDPVRLDKTCEDSPDLEALQCSASGTPSNCI